jgi:predicted N-acetyltransferase YhbS/mannitol-1-phosphate/altronate dehydrogenase
MSLTGRRTFVGFGFGAIQSGLFLSEAYLSGQFRRLVVAEVVPEVVAAVRRNGGYYHFNIAYRDRVEPSRLGPIEILDPAVEADRQVILAAIAEAEEIATAVPSITFYASEKPGSVHRLLAAGLCEKIALGGPRLVIYAAENHNHAAEILEAAVMEQVPGDQCLAVSRRVRFLNTVIGKMSQVITDPLEVQARRLAPITPDLPRAFLVESFNRILVSKVQFPEPFSRGISVFQEKNDLLPFEEAKLYGHNATHALMGYLGALRGVQRVADLLEVPGILPFARAAFIEESGAALIRKHAGLDPLFTPDGYRDFADDLLERMTNPFLVDMIERVTRNTERKLGWNDRLAGTMRVALEQGVLPRRYALGAAAALAAVDPSILDGETPVAIALIPLWRDANPEQGEQDRLIDLIGTALAELKAWWLAGFPDLDLFYKGHTRFDRLPADLPLASESDPALPGLMGHFGDTLTFRPERPGDIPAIRLVEEAAFPHHDEANLVDLARAHGKSALSMLAVQSERVLGHVLFTPVSLDPPVSVQSLPLTGLGLGPIAVLPEVQRSGIGSGLMRAGLEHVRQLGYGFVVLLGDPAYYSRFGFKPGRIFGLTSDYGDGDEFQVLELRPAALAGVNGCVKYIPEFNEVGC